MSKVADIIQFESLFWEPYVEKRTKRIMSSFNRKIRKIFAKIKKKWMWTIGLNQRIDISFPSMVYILIRKLHYLDQPWLKKKKIIFKSKAIVHLRLWAIEQSKWSKCNSPKNISNIVFESHLFQLHTIELWMSVCSKRRMLNISLIKISKINKCRSKTITRLHFISNKKR